MGEKSKRNSERPELAERRPSPMAVFEAFRTVTFPESRHSVSYSITLCARVSNSPDILTPSAFAVLRFITR